ncbi:MAG: hypothetical protein K0R88_1204 [Solirubrobacterales bacterium]|jgi:hypothetical protein|nr:hypothetical protein [Solirubrobacterales bacterium]
MISKQSRRTADRVEQLSPLTDRELDSLAAGPEARLLLEEIIATPREPANSTSRHGRAPRAASRRPRSGRLALAAGVAALAAAVVVTAPGLLGGDSGTAAAGVRFETRGEYILARVTDPFAAADELDAAFEAEGLDIGLSLAPVSPSLVGAVIYVAESGDPRPIESIPGGACVTGGGRCPIGLRIPRDYSGQGEITLGRPAAPGEEYVSTADAFAPGEALHCAGEPGSTVGELLPALEASFAAVEWRRRGGQPLATAPPRDRVVTRVTPVSVDSAIVWTGTERGDATRNSTAAYRASLAAGC